MTIITKDNLLKFNNGEIHYCKLLKEVFGKYCDFVSRMFPNINTICIQI